MTTIALSAQAIGRPGGTSLTRLVFVLDDGEHVRVRFDARKPSRRWECGIHGRQPDPVCVHTFSAALLLAEQLLGLTRVAELQPDPATT